METIKSSVEISQIFSTGKRIHTPYFTVIVSDNTSDSLLDQDKRHGQAGRVAFIAGKKLGNAVWRNRAKRRLRAICYDGGGPWEDFDIIFLAKSNLCKVPYSKVLHVYENIVKQGKQQ